MILVKLDQTDKKILRELQEDASLSLGELAERVGLSQMPVWRRVRRMEDEGVIRKRVALVSPQAVNAGVTAFVMLKTSQHEADWFERFAAAVAAMPEVMEFHRLSGSVDFLLRVALPDLDGYRDFYRRLIEAVDFVDVSTAFAFETVKQTTALPLDFIRSA